MLCFTMWWNSHTHLKLSHYLGKIEEIILMIIWQLRASVLTKVLEKIGIVSDEYIKLITSRSYSYLVVVAKSF